MSKIDLQKVQEKLAILQQFLKDIKPDDQKDLKIGDLKYGIADRFLFLKAQPDVHGYHSNVKLIHTNFKTLKDMVGYISKNKQIVNNNVVIGFKPINDAYHFKVIKVFKDPTDLDKYLILM
jgi:hypothetical protein